MLPGVGNKCDILVPFMMECGWMPLFGRWRAEMTPLASLVCLGADVENGCWRVCLGCLCVVSKPRWAARGLMGVWVERGERKN